MKICCCLVCLIFSLTLSAKSFFLLGKYQNVTVKKVTLSGIHITHDEGVACLKVDELSELERASLAEEVTVYFANNTLSQYNTNGFYVKPSGSSYTDVERAIRVVFCKGDNVADLIYLTNTNGSSWQQGEFSMDGHTHFGGHELIKNTCGKDGKETVYCCICDTNITTVLEATQDHNYVEGVCAVCGKTFCPGGLNHDMKDTVIYENGFLKSGKITSKCQNKDCTYEVIESELEPIFIFKGYSAKIDGSKVTVSYLINKSCLDTYEQINEKTLNFGVVASIANETVSSPISVNNGELTSVNNAVVAPINNAYTGFDFILNGFTSEHYTTPIIMCAYVFDGSQLTYICCDENGNQGQYENAYAITFEKLL